MKKEDIQIVEISERTKHMLPHKQEPFEQIGRLQLEFRDGKWSHREALFEKRMKTYPDEKFDPMDYINNPEQTAFLAVLNGECVGSIRVCRRWNGNGFIDDLAIDKECRGMSIGTKLMDQAVLWSKKKGLNGLSLETQDDNLMACRFYFKYGFEVGGIDIKSYTEEGYKGNIALYLYLEDKIFQEK